MPFIADKKQSPRESNADNVVSIRNKLKTGFDKRVTPKTTKSRHTDPQFFQLSEQRNIKYRYQNAMIPTSEKYIYN